MRIIVMGFNFLGIVSTQYCSFPACLRALHCVLEVEEKDEAEGWKLVKVELCQRLLRVVVFDSKMPKVGSVESL
jgi:hypothetical protein